VSGEISPVTIPVRSPSPICEGLGVRKKPMVRAPKSVVAVVRAHAERLMAESPFCGLLSPEQWQRERERPVVSTRSRGRRHPAST